VEFNALYTEKLNDARKAALQLKSDIDIIVGGENENQRWIDELKAYRNITELSRNVVVSLIKKIAIHEDGTVDITFMYADKFHSTVQILSEIQKTAPIPKGIWKQPSSPTLPTPPRRKAIAERLVV
jgi:hypothetical protein